MLYGFSPMDPDNTSTHSDLILLFTFSHANSLQAFGPILNFWTEDWVGRDERLFDYALKDRKWCTLNVLLVEWKQDVSYRVAIGQICREVWDDSSSIEMDILFS